MRREIIMPESTEHWLQMRAQDITSTEISALFGISPYKTKFELYHQHKDNMIDTIEENERMALGKSLQDAIAVHVNKENGWNGSRFDNYIRLTDDRIGSSFDWVLYPEGGLADCILEVKNVDSLIFRDGWITDDEELQAPPHIELQLQHQMLVMGVGQGKIAALVGGNRTVIIHREADKSIQDRILEESRAFWKGIEDGIAPDPDFAKDAEFISRLYRQSDAGLIIAADQEINSLARDYKLWSAQEKEAKEMKEAIKAQVLMKIGEAGKILGNGFSISTGTVKDSYIDAHMRAGYRSFKVHFKKEKPS